MTTPTFAEASTPETVEQVRDDLLAALDEEGSTISGWSDGAPQRAFVEGEARAIAAESVIVSELAATASPSTVVRAGSSWVDATMAWFQVENADGSIGRLLATTATWEISLAIEPSAAPFTINAANANTIQLQANNGAIFVCVQDSDVVLNSASSFLGVVKFAARLPGITGNATPGQITRVISGRAGLSINLAAVQRRTLTARDDETDLAFIARGLGKWARLGAGWTRPAFDYFIPFFGNGPTTSVTRWSVDDASPTGPGTVLVWVADAAGPASVDTINAIFAGLNGTNVKPVGSGALNVSGAVALPLTLDIVLTVDGSNPDVAANATAALGALAAVFPLGPALLEADLLSAIVRGSPIVSASVTIGTTTMLLTLNLPGFASVIEVTDLDVVGPSIELSPGEVLVLTANVTTVTPP
jgi:hypothetical protein